MVLRPVKDENSTIDTKRGDDVWVLRLIASLVDFARMLNLLYDVALEGGNLACLSIASNLASFFIVVVRVRCHGFGNLDIGDLKEVGTIVGRVGSEQETVNAIVFALWLLDVREPLHSEGWPGQGRSKQLLGHQSRILGRKKQTNPRIISYRNGLFFFHVLYSASKSVGLAPQDEAQIPSREIPVLTLVDESFLLVIFLVVDHVNCKKASA